MKRVTGIGGIFFKAKDPETLWAWYKEHLGIDVRGHGVAVFHWVDDSGKSSSRQTRKTSQNRCRGLRPVAVTSAW